MRSRESGNLSSLMDQKAEDQSMDVGHIQATHQEVIKPKEAKKATKLTKQVGDLSLPVPETFKIAAVGVDEIVKASALRVGEKKAQEFLDKKGFFGKLWYRPSEKALIDKFAHEAEKEIRNNRNLMASIETSGMTNSKGEKLPAGSDLATQAVFDVILESAFDVDRKVEEEMWGLRADPSSRKDKAKDKEYETREHVAHTASMDVAAAEIIAKYVFGDIDRNEFDKQAEERIFQKLAGKAKIKNHKTFTSTLFYVAENYKKSIEGSLSKVGKEFSAADKAKTLNFLKGSVKLDISMAQSKADMYRKKPTGVMRIVEGAINFTQNPLYLSHIPRTIGETKAGKWLAKNLTTLAKIPGLRFLGNTADRLWGVTVGNPMLYAYAGNRLSYAAASGIGIKVALGIGLAAVGFGPATVAAIGAAVGAGSYLGLRAAVEKMRDTRRREDQAILGQQSAENTPIADAREEGIVRIRQLAEKTQPLTEEEKQEIGKWAAMLRVQENYEVNLLGVSKEEGGHFKTNLLAVEDLRRSIFDLIQKKHNDYKGQRTGDFSGQALDFTTYVERAEANLLEILKTVDKEKRAEIIRKGLFVGCVGGAIAGAASILTPEAIKLIKQGSNKIFDATGSSFRYDTSGRTYLEEAAHRLGQKLGWAEVRPTHFGGGLDSHSVILSGGHTDIQLPPGYTAYQIKGPAGEFIGIKDATGHVVPGVAIKVDAAGQVSDAHAWDALKNMGWKIDRIDATTIAAGGGGKAGGTFDSWIKDLRAHLPGGVKVEEVHTQGWYNNPDVDPAGNIVDTPNIANELRLHVVPHGGGMALKVDINHPLFSQGSFRISGGGVDQPDMGALFAAGKLKFVLIPDPAHPHDAIVGSIDSTGHWVFPSGSKVEDLLDPVTHQVRSGVLFGTAVAEPHPGGGLDLTWVNAEHGSSSLPMDYGIALPSTTTTTTIAGWTARPPIAYPFGLPYGPAGYRRETDNDITSAKTKAGQIILEQQKAEERHRFQEYLNSLSPEEKFELALKEFWKGIDDKHVPDALLLEIGPKYLLDAKQQSDLVREALIHPKYGLTQAEIDKINNEDDGDDAQSEPQPAQPAQAAGGHGHGGHGGGEHSTPIAVEKPDPNIKRGRKLMRHLIKLRRDHIRAEAYPETVPQRQALREISAQPDFGPHLEFDADDKLLVGKGWAETSAFANALKHLMQAEGLDPLIYRDRRFRIKISEAGPYELKDDATDKATVITIPPGRSAADVCMTIVDKLKVAGETKYSYAELSEVNNATQNKEPILHFSYDRADLASTRRDDIDRYGKKLHEEIRTLMGTSQGFIDVKLRINFIKPGELGKTEEDAHGYKVVNLAFSNNVKRDARIVFSEMNRLVLKKEKPVDRKFIDDANNDTANKSPYTLYEMDSALIREMGQKEAEAYFNFVKKAVDDKLYEKAKTWDLDDLEIIQGFMYRVKINKDGPFRGIPSDNDRTLTFTFPPNEKLNAIFARFDIQFEDILSKLKDYYGIDDKKDGKGKGKKKNSGGGGGRTKP